MGEFKINLKKSKCELLTVKFLNRLDFSNLSLWRVFLTLCAALPVCLKFDLNPRCTVAFSFLHYFLFFFEQELAFISHSFQFNTRLILLTYIFHFKENVVSGSLAPCHALWYF